MNSRVQLSLNIVPKLAAGILIAAFSQVLGDAVWYPWINA